MMTWRGRQRIAGWLGLCGGILGILAGLAQTTLGSRIPEWTGHKASLVALGLLTVGLSVIGVLCALLLLRHPELTPQRRIAVAVGLFVAGGLCFSTAGILWYLPGVLLLGASGYAVLAGDPLRTRQIVMHTWLHLLISVLGAFEVLMAVSAGPVAAIVVGVVGGLALMTAPWIQGLAVPGVLQLIGTVPFAILTWWTVASPLLAVLALGMGVVLLRTGRRRERLPRRGLIERLVTQ
ncbi:MFS family permease [Nakamurella sp. UYEF19]|uniref:hypothetical protein n=1 Tax=Nakamurella sp. UYEF19 TaxID=1756392 RepID=UPI003392F69D